MNRAYSCLGKTISLQIPSDWENNLKTIDFWIKRFCPLVELFQNINCVPNYTIECIESTNYNYKISNNRIVITGKWTKYEGFLAKLVTQVFQNLLIDDDICFMPAACVINNNSAILIIGDFGQGKTSVAMNFANRKGFSLLTDNYVAIKNNKVIGGTEFLSIRKENNSTALDLDQNIYLLENRLYFRNLQNHRRDLSNTKIIGILNPHINSSGNEFHFISYDESVWFLYQKLTRLINGETVLFIDKMPSPSFNNTKRRHRILAYTAQLLRSCGILYASAPIDFIVDHSMEYFTNKQCHG